MARRRRERKWVVLITCEHGGHKVPAPFLHEMSKLQQKELLTHKGWDLGALGVARYLAKHLDVPLHSTQISRLLVDCNRSAHHPKCLGPAFRCLEAAEKNFILALYYWPHRNAIESQILSHIQQGRSVLHLAVHSFTPKLDGMVRNAEIGLLYDPSRPSEKTWANGLAREIQERLADLRLRRNYPYLGTSDGLTTWLRKHYDANEYAGIEIEVNQSLFKKSRATQGLQRALVQSVESLLIRRG